MCLHLIEDSPAVLYTFTLLFHFTFALHHPRDNKEQGMNSVLVQFNSTSKCRTLVWTLLAFNAFAVQ